MRQLILQLLPMLNTARRIDALQQGMNRLLELHKLSELTTTNNFLHRGLRTQKYQNNNDIKIDCKKKKGRSGGPMRLFGFIRNYSRTLAATTCCTLARSDGNRV